MFQRGDFGVEFRNAMAGGGDIRIELIGGDEIRLSVAGRDDGTPVATVLLDDFDERAVQTAFGEQVHRHSTGWRKVVLHDFRLNSATSDSNSALLKTTKFFASPCAIFRGGRTVVLCSAQKSTTGR